jgi:hypothetical protein
VASQDLVDVEGDKAGGIETFTTRLGPKVVARAASVVLLLNYAAAIGTALLAAPGTFRRALMIGGHALAAGWMLLSTLRLNADSVESLKQYYKQSACRPLAAAPPPRSYCRACTPPPCHLHATSMPPPCHLHGAVRCSLLRSRCVA